MFVVAVRAVTYTFTERQIALIREAVCDFKQTINTDEQACCYAELNDLADELREIADGFNQFTMTDHLQ